jgi:predicted ATPase/DNA-binding SARP family transcriptional activator
VSIHPNFPPMEIRLFGGFDVRIQGEAMPLLRSRREQWLFALLALRHRQDTARDWLATTLWPDAEESQALFYLRKSLSNLRTALGAETARLLSPSPRTVRLNLADAFADFVELEAAHVSPHLSQEQIENAVGLYGGILLPKCSEEWIFSERERFAQLHLSLLEILAENAQDGGQPADSVRWLRRVVAVDPYRENAYQRLMQTLADCGDLAAVTQVYRELRVRLHSDLNSSPSLETEQLYRQLQANPVHAIVRTVAPSETASRRHLPVPLTDLIGREAEIEEVSGWLLRRRLATLLGSGGIGKTRLAIASAEALLPRFPDGVWFVDFAATADPLQVPSIVAKTLGIPNSPTRSPEIVLAERLAEQTLLLVFDNCEHVLDATAVLGYELLSACAELRILATSRQALGVTGEQVIPITPLAFPVRQEPNSLLDTARQEKDPHFLMEYPAIRLFVERAIQSDPTFRLTRKNQNAVVAIVQELDGIPLAIEMAAARLRSFTLSEIETRLTARLQLLTTGNRGGRPRHQTLRAAIDWSFDLLSEAEQILLRRLSVFAGGWTQDAAEAVCFETVEPETAARCADLHALLLEKSLIVRETLEGSFRFRMLMTVREYAAEQLEQSGETIEIEQRHLMWCCRFAEAIKDRLNGTDDAEMMLQMDHDYANIRAALEFARRGEQFEDGLLLLTLLLPYWTARGMMREGAIQCRALLDDPAVRSQTTTWAAALRAGAWMAHHRNDYNEAERYASKSLAVSRAIADYAGQGFALSLLAACAAERGQLEAACQWSREAVALRREYGKPSTIAGALTTLGEILQVSGDTQGAREAIEEALILRRELNIPYGIAASQYALSRVLYQEQNYQAAENACREAVTLFEETSTPFWASAARIQLAWIVMQQRQYSEGLAVCQEGFEAQRTLENTQFITLGISALAEAACHFGQWEQAASLHGAIEKLRQESHCFVLPVEHADHARQKSATQNALGETAYREFAAQSSELSLPEIFELALEADESNLSASYSPAAIIPA